jgi:hypothetical protein
LDDDPAMSALIKTVDLTFDNKFTVVTGEIMSRAGAANFLSPLPRKRKS